jgi:hypothetical protein
MKKVFLILLILFSIKLFSQTTKPKLIEVSLMGFFDSKEHKLGIGAVSPLLLKVNISKDGYFNFSNLLV